MILVIEEEKSMRIDPADYAQAFNAEAVTVGDVCIGNCCSSCSSHKAAA